MTPKKKLHPIFEQSILATGAAIYLYEGEMDAANSLAEKTAQEYGWFHTGLFYEPYRLEACKTIAYEIAESFDWVMPDVIVTAVGNGCVLSGIYKGLRDLQQLGWVSKSLPKLVAVQLENNNHIVQAFENKMRSVSVPGDNTNSGSYDPHHKIFNDIQGTRMVMDGIYKSMGCAISVTEKETKVCRDLLTAREGIFVGDNAAMSLAALIKLSKSGWLGNVQSSVIYNSENGILTAGKSSIGSPELLSSFELGAIPQSAGERS